MPSSVRTTGGWATGTQSLTVAWAGCASPPLMNMDEAIKEVRWAKDHGAVGIFKKGNREADHNFTEEYFDPLWDVANELEMPVCMHIGSGIPNIRENRTDGDFRGPRVPFAYLPETFTSLVLN